MSISLRTASLLEEQNSVTATLCVKDPYGLKYSVDFSNFYLILPTKH